jgi:hypothetical protein
MKILFYVEPHPLRDSFTSHSQPYRTFLNICRQIKSSPMSDDFQDVDIRVFSNHVLQELKFNENIDMWPLILSPSNEEQQGIEEMARLWLPNGIKDWLDLCSNPDAKITKFYMNLLSRIRKEQFCFDVIVSWGQNQAIQSFAEANSIQTVYFELASMRPPFPRALLMDPVGVNGAASSTFINIDQLINVIEKVPTSLLFSALNDEFHKQRQNSNLFNSAYYPVALPEFDIARKVAIIPLQLADDANLLLYSDFKSIEDFTDGCVSLLSAHNWNIFIKPHPHARLRGGYVEHAQNKIIKRYQAASNIKILADEIGDNEYLSLISSVDLVVTNNSSVGFESLLCGTQCVTLGKSCYSIIGGLPTLDAFLESSPEEKSRYKNYAEYITTYLLSCSFPLERKLAAELVARIRLWKELVPPNKGDGETWIRRNVEALGWTNWHNNELMRNYFLTSKRHISETEKAAKTVKSYA